MSKFLKIYITILCAVFLPIITVNAYSSEEYNIVVPDSYTENPENVFVKQDGNNFNIQITENESGKFYYNDDFLNQITDSFVKEMDLYIGQIKEKVKEQYKGIMTEQQIEDYISTIKLNGLVSKEVTTFTKNNYPVFHYVMNYTFGDADYNVEFYQLASDKKIYTVTITGVDDTYRKSDEVKEILNSFTITNYVDVSADEDEYNLDKLNSFLKTSWGISIIIGIIVISLATIISIYLKKQKNEKI